MKKLICSVIIVVLFCSVCYSKEIVKCKAVLADKPTKDGFGKITLVCEGVVYISKGKNQIMYAKESLIVFDQTDVPKDKRK